MKVAIELEAFDKAEGQRQGNKYVRGTACTSVSTELPSEHSVIQPILERLGCWSRSSAQEGHQFKVLCGL